jgi:hypothetical protein
MFLKLRTTQNQKATEMMTSYYEPRTNTAVSLMKRPRNKPEAKKKGISFDASFKMIEIMGLDDYTSQEIEASWYTGEEMAQISRRCLKILDWAETKRSRNDKIYCMRGLEGHTTLGSISKRRNRETSIMSVLEEQIRQNGEIDFESLSKVYSCTTSSSLMWAMVVGNRDQQEAEAYLHCNEDSYDSVGQENILQTRDRIYLKNQIPNPDRSPRSSHNHQMNARAAQRTRMSIESTQLIRSRKC